MPLPRPFRVFLSAVSSEFAAVRAAIASDLRSRGLEVKFQDDFRQEADADTTLRLLHNYLRDCDAVVCLVGTRSGDAPPAPAAEPFRALLPPDFPEPSYTQWEFFFARHYRKRLSVYIAGGYPPEQPQPTGRDFPELAQQFLLHLKGQGLNRSYFGNRDELRAHVLRQDWPAAPPRRIVQLPYPSIGTLFKGRDAFLQRLREQLQQYGHTTVVAKQAIHGLGGVGKTRLAIEYAWQHEADYTAILFLGADSPASLRQNLAALCGPLVLDLAEQTAKEEEVRVEAALRWLHGNPGWFLILDNVDTPEAAAEVEQMLARLHSGHVCITSRIADWSGAVEPLELDVLDPASAKAFLLDRTADRRRLTPSDETDAHDLAEDLGQLALALEQAGAFICKFRCSLADYRERWSARETTVREWYDAKLMKYPRRVAVTWDTSVAQLDAGGLALLRMLCWFGPEPIPRDVLETDAAREVLKEGTARAGGSAPSSVPRMETAVAALSELSLLKWSSAGTSLVMHRLVAEVMRYRLAKDDCRWWLEAALRALNEYVPNEPWNVRTWERWDLIRPHVAAVVTHADSAGIAQPTARLIICLGLLLHAKALHRKAEPLYRRALVIYEAAHGPDHPEVARALNNLALLLRATNRLTSAEPLLRRALTIKEATYGPEHPEVAVSLSNLAELLHDTNRLAEAEPLHRRALAIAEAAYGPEHPAVAIHLSNLAGLLQATNRLAEAEPLFRRALAIDEAAYGSEHPTVAIHLNNLAGLLQATNRLAEAEPLFRRALAIDEAAYGPEHPTVAIRLDNLAVLLRATNRLAEAEPLMRRDVEIFHHFAQVNGHLHPDMHAALQNYRGLLEAMHLSTEEIAARLQPFDPAPTEPEQDTESGNPDA